MIKKVTVIFTMVILTAMLVSCGTDDIDISDFKDQNIALVGLTEKEESISVEQLKGLECVTKETESTSDKIGKVRATGPLLTTVAEKFGVNLSDFSKVIIYGEDDYDIKLKKDFLEENQVILAFGIDKEPVGEDSRPVRLIIPESDSAYWVRMVHKVEFVK